ncbi:hypothetical protein GOODEAATRI_034562, partial [Goodea atripinnis]
GFSGRQEWFGKTWLGSFSSSQSTLSNGTTHVWKNLSYVKQEAQTHTKSLIWLYCITCADSSHFTARSEPSAKCTLVLGTGPWVNSGHLPDTFHNVNVCQKSQNVSASTWDILDLTLPGSHTHTSRTRPTSRTLAPHT